MEYEVEIYVNYELDLAKQSVKVFNENKRSLNELSSRIYCFHFPVN